MADNIISIIEGCLTGNANSWDALFKEFAPMAMNILNGRFSGTSVHEKEDIIQNVFVKLIKGGLNNFRGTSKYEFLSYFKRIVHNEALSLVSSIKNNITSLNQNRETEEGELPPFEVPDENPGQENTAAAMEVLNIIRNILKEYPLEDQQIFLMKLEGAKDKEIADILKISMGTVASKYSRIKDRLRTILG